MKDIVYTVRCVTLWYGSIQVQGSATQPYQYLPGHNEFYERRLRKPTPSGLPGLATATHLACH